MDGATLDYLLRDSDYGIVLDAGSLGQAGTES